MRGCELVFNELYEFNLKNKSLRIDLDVSDGENQIIKIYARKNSISKNTLKKIIKITENWGGTVKLLPYGTITIHFEAEEKNEAN